MTDNAELIAQLRAWKRLPVAEWELVASKAATALEALKQPSAREVRLEAALRQIEGMFLDWNSKRIGLIRNLARTALGEG